MGYQLDVALAEAGERELCALAVYGAPATSLTAIRLADRVRVALLTIDPSVDLTDLAFGLARLIRTRPGEVLVRALDGQRAVTAAEPDGTEAVLAAAGQAVGGGFTLSEGPAGVAVPVTSDGRADGFVCAHQDDPAAVLTAHLLAGAIGRIRTLAIKTARRPAQAQADALASLLGAPATAVGRAAERARDVGVRLHEDLAVMRIELVSEPGRDLLTRRAMDEELDDLVLAGMTGRGLVSHAGRRRAAARPRAGRPRRLPAERVLAAVRDAFPAATVFCGVGAHLARPARACARAPRRPPRRHRPRAAGAGRGRPCTSTPWACRRCWSTGSAHAPPSSPPSACSPRSTTLDEARAEAAVRTLSTYLDEHGSLTRSAEPAASAQERRRLPHAPDPRAAGRGRPRRPGPAARAPARLPRVAADTYALA